MNTRLQIMAIQKSTSLMYSLVSTKFLFKIVNPLEQIVVDKANNNNKLRSNC